jgi:hypothetical protein
LYYDMGVALERCSNERQETLTAFSQGIRSWGKGKSWAFNEQTEDKRYEFDIIPAYSVEDPQKSSRWQSDRPPSYRESPPSYSRKAQSYSVQESEGIEEEFHGIVYYWGRPVGLGSEHGCSERDSDNSTSSSCPVTYEENQGFTLTSDYVKSLEEDQEVIINRLDEARAKLARFQKLYWASRNDYYFSHLSCLDLNEPDKTRDTGIDHQGMGKIYSKSQKEGIELGLRKLADTDHWRDIYCGEQHLYELEREVHDATQDFLMVQAELFICMLNLDVRVPRTWRFSKGLDLRTWSATEGQGGMHAEGFLGLPDHQRVLTFNGKRYN